MKYLRFFLNPPGRGLGLFFFKFLLFAGLAYFIWVEIQVPYNNFLQDVAQYWLSNDATVSSFIRAHRFTPERGLYEMSFAPYTADPVQPSRTEHLSIKMMLNVLHMNIIPFLAFFFATPFFRLRRFLVYFLISAIILVASHIAHVVLDINAYYFQYQMDNNYFTRVTVTLQELQDVIKPWKTRIRILILSQAFMEQAGSMLIPAFLWMIYAAPWLLAGVQPVKRVTASSPRQTSPPSKADPEASQESQTP